MRPFSDAWTVLLASRLGACWKCMALSAFLLTASLAALLVPSERFPVAAVFASMASGFFMTLTATHMLMFLIRRVVRSRERLPHRHLTRTCCG